MGTSQQPEPKLGTGIQLEPTQNQNWPQNALHTISGSSLFKIKNSSIKIVFSPPFWLRLDTLLVWEKNRGLE
jgi:hypothetical protein